MTKKKQTQPAISQGESEQVQSMLAQYHQIAAQLRTCTDEEQAQAALAEINNMPAGAQIAFLKELAREQHTDAADVLAALHAFGELKDARKEARRSLIRLEGTKIYPDWEAPLVSPLEDKSLQTVIFPPRFFKGLVTDTRESGEVQLILCWEMGEDYREVRMLGFLLEFWHDGIKDFFTSPETKRSFAKLLSQMTGRLDDAMLKECSLEEGARLLEEAKAVNARYGTKPHRDYISHLSLINQLIPENLAMQIISDINLRNLEEEEEEVDLSDLAPQDIVANFVEGWVDGELGMVYQLLSQDSPLREGLTKDEWIDRRDEWAEKFEPDDMQPTLLHTRATPKPRVWRPASMSKQNSETTKEVEAGWSVEFSEILLDNDDKLPELPTPVTVYAATKRHWFWASFTLVKENDVWHIQSMTDEYVKAQGLSAATLEKRLEELDQRAENAARSLTPEQIKQMDDAEQLQFIEETLLPMEESLYYAEILLKKEPLERSLYEETAGRAVTLGQYERGLVHLQALLERFPEEHALIYQRTAEVQQRLVAKYAEEDYDEREIFYLDQAEKSLFAALALEENVETHISLAEVLLERDERLDEAKSHLLQAKNAASKPDEEAHIEMHLGEIALKQEQHEAALSHFQRAAELEPEDADYWETIGGIQQTLENFSEAASSYQRAIELDPHDPEYYSALGLLYKHMDQDQRAIQALKDGLAANPESVELHLYLAAAYETMGHSQQAEDFLEKAERLDPDSELVASYRRTFALNKLKQPYRAQKPLKLTGPKKKKRH